MRSEFSDRLKKSPLQLIDRFYNKASVGLHHRASDCLRAVATYHHEDVFFGHDNSGEMLANSILNLESRSERRLGNDIQL